MVYTCKYAVRVSRYMTSNGIVNRFYTIYEIGIVVKPRVVFIIRTCLSNLTTYANFTETRCYGLYHEYRAHYYSPAVLSLRPAKLFYVAPKKKSHRVCTRMFTMTSRVCSDCDEGTIVGACTKLKFKK